MIREEEFRRFAETGICLGEVRESETLIRLCSGQAFRQRPRSTRHARSGQAYNMPTV